MLRRLLTVLSLLGLLGLINVAEARPIVIKLGTIAPEGSIWHDALLQLRQRWHELSDGRVELRIYAGGVLGGEDEMIRKIQRRGLDAVAISGSGLPTIDRSAGSFNLPLLFTSYEELDFVRSHLAATLEARFERRHFKVLNWAEGGWVYFFSKKPVRTPDDLRHLRLWIAAGDPDSERIFKDFGFQVVPLPATDMLTSLQSGLIEVVDVPPLFALLDRSYQAAPYMTDLRWAPLNAATVIGLHAWQRIPPRDRPALLQAAREAGRRLRSALRQAEQEAIREMQARGLTIIELDAATRQIWQREAEAAWPRLRGTLIEPELYDQIMKWHRVWQSRIAAPARR